RSRSAPRRPSGFRRSGCAGIERHPAWRRREPRRRATAEDDWLTAETDCSGGRRIRRLASPGAGFAAPPLALPGDGRYNPASVPSGLGQGGHAQPLAVPQDWRPENAQAEDQERRQEALLLYGDRQGADE